ncbi:hypothetical protein BIW11_10610 [Tropilaelaps mercedesae]|uniref:Uncharacterized protein n=1 Tax=Tropilaelaps mercedesae TaxID=418985 RepID=A0A1V9XF90_9ACAR|nr:hypothetical protein BIW11_10610 [Tropilaelaps mercedesae]
MSPRSRSRKTPRLVRSSLIRTHLLKLLFFVITFTVFVVLQDLLTHTGQIRNKLYDEFTGVSPWIIVLAVIGTLPVLGVLFLGLDELFRRISKKPGDGYEDLNLESELEESSDVEDGHPFQKNYREEPVKKKFQPALGASSVPPGGKSQKSERSSNHARMGYDESRGGESANGYSGGHETNQDSQDAQNPTDVDVAVRPVDTTIAAGGEARVSPIYNVSLMSVANESPPGPGGLYESDRIYPTAPAMIQSGAAYFKRGF